MLLSEVSYHRITYMQICKYLSMRVMQGHIDILRYYIFYFSNLHLSSTKRIITFSTERIIKFEYENLFIYLLISCLNFYMHLSGSVDTGEAECIERVFLQLVFRLKKNFLIFDDISCVSGS